MLRHVVDCATRGGSDPVFVVLGAHADRLREELRPTRAQIVVNSAWRAGLGTSVRAAVRAVQQRCPGAGGVLLLSCDQARITPSVVHRLHERFHVAEARMVACEYAGTVGVPALFNRSLFAELLALEDDQGAKRVLLAHVDEVVRIDWPQGAIDVDTLQDYESLNDD